MKFIKLIALLAIAGYMFGPAIGDRAQALGGDLLAGVTDSTDVLGTGVGGPAFLVASTAIGIGAFLRKRVNWKGLPGNTRLASIKTIGLATAIAAIGAPLFVANAVWDPIQAGTFDKSTLMQSLAVLGTIPATFWARKWLRAETYLRGSPERQPIFNKRVNSGGHTKDQFRRDLAAFVLKNYKKDGGGTPYSMQTGVLEVGYHTENGNLNKITVPPEWIGSTKKC